MKPNNIQSIRLRGLIEDISTIKDSEANFISIGKLVRSEIDFATKKNESDYLNDLESVLQKASYYFHQKENKKANFDNFVKAFLNSINAQYKRISRSIY
jgi:hypothetical protein